MGKYEISKDGINKYKHFVIFKELLVLQDNFKNMT